MRPYLSRKNGDNCGQKSIGMLIRISLAKLCWDEKKVWFYFEIRTTILDEVVKGIINEY